jgi:hypothetical protein
VRQRADARDSLCAGAQVSIESGRRQPYRRGVSLRRALAAALLSSSVIAACAPPGPTPSAFGPRPGPTQAQSQPGTPTPYASLPPPGGQPADPYAGGEPATAGAAPIGDLSRYAAYAVPKGWTEQRSDNFISVIGGQCAFHLVAPFQSGASLEETLDAAFAQYYAGFGFMYDSTTYDKVAYGTSAAGWRYRRVEAPLRSTTNPDQYFQALAFAADLGGEVAIVFGMDNLAGRCFLERWGLFQDGLAFAGFTDRDDALADEIVGTWMAASSTAGFSVTYRANGTYDWVGLSESDRRLNDQEVLRTTTTFDGDGTWTLRGPTLITKPHRSSDETVVRIRVETQESRGRRERFLCQVKTDVGGQYESCLSGSVR